MELKNCYEVCVFEHREGDEVYDGDYRSIDFFDTYEETESAYANAVKMIGTERDGVVIDYACIFEYDENGLCEEIESSY